MDGADTGDEDLLPLYVTAEQHSVPPRPADPTDPVGAAGVAPDAWAPRPAGFSAYAWLMPSRLITMLTFLLAGVVALLLAARRDSTGAEPSLWPSAALGAAIVLLVPLRYRLPRGQQRVIPGTQGVLRTDWMRRWLRQVGPRLLLLPAIVALLGVVAPEVVARVSALLLTGAVLFAATQVGPLAILERRRHGRLVRAYRPRSRFRVDVLEAMTYPGHVLYESAVVQVTGSTPPGGPAEPLARIPQMAIARREGDLARALALGAASYAPSDPPLTCYVACLAIEDGQLELGLQWLERAAADGYWDVAAMAKDPDLAPVRGTPQFAAIRSQVAANARALGLRVRRR